MLEKPRAEIPEQNEQDVVISFENIGKKFYVKNNEVTAVKDCSFSVLKNEFTTIIGPSGCGKTTLLRLCSGLEVATEGTVLYKGKEVSGIVDGMGFITQDSNLFPWLTTLKNVEYPLKLRGVPEKERREKAQYYIDMVGLTGFENHYPYQLSGGMQKRASIIRTLIYDPEVILMDEPFGPLDALTRIQLQAQLLEIWEKSRKTILFITHDLVEAIGLSDRVVIMTHRPSKIKEIRQINLERPRDMFQIHSSKGFSELYEQIWSSFRGELVEE